MVTRSPEHQALVAQLEQLAAGLAQTFAPFCEVVLHDLTDPEHTILAIHNNLSGRALGQPATELGLARIADPSYPQVVANYANRFADGRPAKSTSIGIRDASGRYVAALCMNVDVGLFHGVQRALEQFTAIDPTQPVRETLAPANGDLIRQRIDQFAARRATTPRALTAADRRTLIQELKSAGLLELRRAADTIAGHLGISRTSVYNYAK